MSSVWLADDSLLGRQVALKILRQDTPDLARRMHREAEVISRIESPHIAPVYDSGELESGEVYIAMKYIPGKTLDKLGTLPESRARYIFAQILEGLQAAHEAGVIHRDIKPSNIIVEEEDRVYLVDFGVARDTKTTADLTQTGTVIGTAHYLSPEQAHGERATVQSDLYSLGIMLYEALTGEHPWPGVNSIAQAISQATEPADPPSRYESGIDSRLDQTVLRAIAYRPDLRFRSADEFRLALLDKSPLHKRRPWWLLSLPLVLVGVWIFWQSGKTTVPDVAGESLLEARKTLSSQNLRWQTKSTQSSLPRGRVVRTSPESGLSLREDSVVMLWVSAGPKKVLVPELTEKTFAKAEALLLDSGLLPQRKNMFSALPPETVVRSAPEGGRRVGENSSVVLWVSQGSAPSLVPDCISKTEETCRRLALEEGISLRTEYWRSDLKSGQVVDQFPDGGRAGTTLKIYVTRGSTLIQAPNLLGLSLESARRQLSRLGIGSIVSQQRADSPSLRGKIIRQSPLPRGGLARGEVVTLFVGI